MSTLAIGGIGFAAMLLLLALRIPIAISMLSVGLVGYTYIAGTTALLSYLKTETYWRFSTDDLSVIPLFLLMGQFATLSGMSSALSIQLNAPPSASETAWAMNSGISLMISRLCPALMRSIIRMSHRCWLWL